VLHSQTARRFKEQSLMSGSARTPPFLSACAAALLAQAGCGAGHLPISGRTVESSLTSSNVAGQSYRIFVRLPPSYDQAPAQQFPVVYQLDANFLSFDEFGVTAGLASKLEATGQIPEVIVVGVGYDGPDQRFRDFVPELGVAPSGVLPTSGGAFSFYRFVRDELQPSINKTYRIDTASGATLMGHSLGGFFSLWSLFQQDSAPPVFSHFVAADPTSGYDRAVLLGYEARLATRTMSLPVSLLITYAGVGSFSQPIVIDALAAQLAGHGYAGLRSSVEEISGDHGEVLSPSFERGLLYSLGGAK
jgi:predicted alpha/beta superfamily hydrolase